MSTLKALVVVCLIGCCLAAPKPVDWDQVGRKIKNFGNQVRDKVNEVKEKVLPVAQSACEYINTIPQVPRFPEFQKQINFNTGFPRNPSLSYTPRFPQSNSFNTNRFSSSLNPSTRVFNSGFIPRRPTPEVSRFNPLNNGYNPKSFLGAGRAPTTERVFNNLNPNWSRFYPFTSTERVFNNLNPNRSRFYPSNNGYNPGSFLGAGRAPTTERVFNNLNPNWSRFYPFTSTERVFTNLNPNRSRFYPSNNGYNPGSFLGAGRAATTEGVFTNLNFNPSRFNPMNKGFNPGSVLGAGAAPTTEKVATNSGFKPSTLNPSNNITKPSIFRPFNNPGPVIGAGAASTTEKVATNSSFKPSTVNPFNNVSNEVAGSGFDLSNVTPNGFKGASSTPGFTFEQKDLNDGEIPHFPKDEDDIDSSFEEINDNGIDNSGLVLSKSSKLVSRYAY